MGATHSHAYCNLRCRFYPTWSNLATRTHMRIATEALAGRHNSAGWQPALTCVLQQKVGTCGSLRTSGNPHSHAYCNAKTGAQSDASQLATRTHMRIATSADCRKTATSIAWQPALTCVLQRQKCTILQHAEFVNAGLFVYGYLLSLGLKKSRRVSTEYRSEKHFLLRILSAKIRVCIS